MSEHNALPPGFKMTELGPLPEEWQVVRLEKCVKVIKGRKPATLTEVPVSGSLPYLTAEYFRTSRARQYVPSEVLPSAETCQEQDIVLIWDGSNAGQVFTGLAGVLASTMVKIVPKRRDITRGFLYFYLLTQFENLNSQTTGSTIPHVNKVLFHTLPIPLPPLAEQRAIAQVLRTVQEAKEATERVIAALKELKKSLMRHLFTYGSVPVGETDRVPLREAEIGPVPAHWRVVRLGEVVKLRSNVINPADNPTARYVGLEHIDSGSIRIERFGFAYETKSSKNIFKEGDILYGKLRPYLDKAALAEWEGVCSTDILVFQPKDVADPVFTAHLLHHPWILNHAIATTTGVNHPRTSWKALSQAIIPLPPLPEQQEIARILEAVDAKIAAEEGRREALAALFKSLLAELMSGRRRVRFTAEDAESAEKIEKTLRPLRPLR